MKRTFILILSLLLIVAAATGCAANDYKSEIWLDDNGPAGEPNAMEEGALPEGAVPEIPLQDMTGSLEDAGAFSERKLVTRVWFTVETEHYAELIPLLERRTGELGGYIEAMEASTPYGGTRQSASMTIRIPAKELNALVTTVQDNSNVVHTSREREDVTLSYSDTQARRDALRTEQERLMELLEQAENLTDVLAIEDRMTEVRYELESMESALRTMDNQIDYATVFLTVEEVEVLTPVQEAGFWQKIGEGFLKSIRGVWTGLKAVFSWIIIALPYAAVILVPPGVVLLIIFSVKRRKNKK